MALPFDLDDRVAGAFRRMVSGDDGGRPAWVRALETGDDAGLFGPGSAPWVVHGDVATLVGGVRALLLQALHPGALAGVEQHSRYEADPLGRLSGTTRWLVSLTFGDSRVVERESARVRAMHARVQGSYTAADGAPRPYSAADGDLLTWVHLAFTDSFLTTHLTWGRDGGAVPGGPDAYVREWARAVEPLGAGDMPRSREQLRRRLASFDDQLRGGDDVRDVVRFVLDPPLPAAARPAYAVLVTGAVSTLPTRYRRLLGLGPVPRVPARLAVSALLGGMRLALGPTSPSEQAARARISRLAREAA